MPRRLMNAALVAAFLLLLAFLAAAPVIAADPDAAGYELGSGDKIRVTVFGEEDLSGTFVVDGKGVVAMPLIGQVGVGGLDVRAAEQKLVAEYKRGFLKRPRVSIEILNFRPFYILGEVKEPGSYPYVDGMSVVEAVAVAGGFTYRAKKEFVEVQRGEDDAKKELRLPVTARVQPGDVIRVEERFF